MKKMKQLSRGQKFWNGIVLCKVIAPYTKASKDMYAKCVMDESEIYHFTDPDEEFSIIGC